MCNGNHANVQFKGKYEGAASASYVINPGASSVKTIKSLKKGKYYYMKGRSYKKVGSTTYYGAWSKTKLRKKSNRATQSCSGSADKDE